MICGWPRAAARGVVSRMSEVRGRECDGFEPSSGREPGRLTKVVSAQTPVGRDIGIGSIESDVEDDFEEVATTDQMTCRSFFWSSSTFVRP